MERFTILLRSVQEASKFVDKVSAYAETVYLRTGPYQIDAQSFLGVVLTYEDSVFASAGHHSVRLVCTLCYKVVDERSEV